MGQYFIAVNCTKKEYFSAWGIGGTAKFWEWCANPHGAVFCYLLRKSDESGGGDMGNPGEAKYAGRWAGDEVYLVGDYDSSGLYSKANAEYTNIARGLVDEYNEFIENSDLKLSYQSE